MSFIELRTNNVVQHIDLTDQQALVCLHGQPLAWTSPEVPDEVSVDEGGTLIEREDGRSQYNDNKA